MCGKRTGDACHSYTGATCGQGGWVEGHVAQPGHWLLSRDRRNERRVLDMFGRGLAGRRHGQTGRLLNALPDWRSSSLVLQGVGQCHNGSSFQNQGRGEKPADVFIPRWAGALDAALDVTVINPLQEAQVQGAAASPGHALEAAQKRKLDKSWEACHRQGIEFIPIAVESLGAWHKSAIVQIGKLGSALARQNGEEEGTTIQRLFQQLSVALMRGNCTLLNNSSPADQLNGAFDIM